MKSVAKKRRVARKRRYEISIPVGNPPPCLGEDCIIRYGLEYKNIAATRVNAVEGDNCPKLGLDAGVQAIDDWLKGMKAIIEALASKKQCASDCACDEVGWKWTVWIRKDFDLVFTRGLCKYQVLGRALVRTGRLEGICSLPDTVTQPL